MKVVEGATPVWSQENPSICRFCAFAKRFAATSDVFCEKKKNFMSDEESCRKFKYDILKKDLRRGRTSAIKHNPADFEI